MKLLFNALIKFAAGLLLVGLLLFLPAWTLNYPGAWLFIGLLFVPMLILGVVLLVKSPSLLEKRLDAKEKRSTQKGVIAFSGLIFPVGFILAALDFRFGWSSVPGAVIATASGLFLIGYAMYAEVMRENEYLSRTVEVQDGQRVIDTGLYGVVRHPMYLASLLMFLPLPIILGSWYALIPFGFYPIIIIFRIIDEERLLKKELSGYSEYTKKVKYRLIPFVW